MKVKDLIKELKKFDPELPVFADELFEVDRASVIEMRRPISTAVGQTMQRTKILDLLPARR